MPLTSLSVMPWVTSTVSMGKVSQGLPTLLWDALGSTRNGFSRRIVYYTSSELVWECRETPRCQCGFMENGTLTERKAYHNHVLQTPGAYFEPSNSVDLWKEIINNYTTCQLIYETDRLLALSGIAHQLQDRGYGSYVARMWTSLLWFLFTAIRILYRAYMVVGLYERPHHTWRRGRLDWSAKCHVPHHRR